MLILCNRQNLYLANNTCPMYTKQDKIISSYSRRNYSGKLSYELTTVKNQQHPDWMLLPKLICTLFPYYELLLSSQSSVFHS